MEIENKNHYFVYLTTNLITDKQYVGEHGTDNIDNDKYLGSGRILNIAIKKYGRNSFKIDILQFFNSKKEAFDAQEKFIKLFNTLSPNGYNIDIKGGSRPTNSPNEETKEKIGKANKDHKHTDEAKRKFSEARKGKKFSEIHKSNLSKALIGHKVSSETKEKIGKANTGKIKSQETIDKAVNSFNKNKKNHKKPEKPFDKFFRLFGKEKAEIMYAEYCKTKSDAVKGEKNGMFGKKQSEESKEKNRKAQTGKKQSEETKCKRVESRRKYEEEKKLDKQIKNDLNVSDDNLDK